MELEPYRPGLGQNHSLVRQLKELQKNPRSLIFVTLADAYRAEMLPHQALDILEEGLAYHAGLSSALLVKARCLFDLRRFAESLAVCRELLQSNPDNIKAQKLQAEIFIRLGQRRAAIRSLTRVLELFPQDRETAKALEELENLETGVLVPPERVSRASVDTPPAALGRIEEFQVGSFRETLASLPREEEDTPTFFPEPSELLEPSEPARALITVPSPSPLSTAEQEDEPSADPTFATRTIAELYLRQGLKAKALKVLRKILQEDPTHAWARETLQDLGSDGIVPLAQKSPADRQRAALAAKVKRLEQMLAQVRLRRASASGA